MKKTITFFALMVATSAMAQIQIATVEDLKAISDPTRTDYPLDGSYVLKADIDLRNETNWSPIGYNPTDNTDVGSFNGTFDGKGPDGTIHTISGLNINTDNSNVYIGLFARIGASGKVKNLKLSGGSIKVTESISNASSNIGTIAGVNHGQILNCTVEDIDIFCYASGSDCGGIVGENGGDDGGAEGYIKNCAFNGAVLHGNSYSGQFGGFVGNNSTKGTIQNCMMIVTPPKTTYESTPTQVTTFEGQDNGYVYDCYYQNGNGVKLEGRTLYKDGFWNTICLPFDVSDGNLNDDIPFTGTPFAGAIVKELDTESEVDGNQTGINGNTLYLNFKDANSIEAGKPYIIKWGSGEGIKDPLFTGVTITKTEPDNVSSTDGNVTFKGIFFSKDIGQLGDNTVLYLGDGNQTYYPTGEMSINALRAYFQLNGYEVYTGSPEPGSSTVNAFNLNFNDESTAVLRIEAKEDQSGVVYDLSGRVVESDHLKPGIYIRGGKKFLMRK